jgi:hypothetical protein
LTEGRRSAEDSAVPNMPKGFWRTRTEGNQPRSRTVNLLPLRGLSGTSKAHVAQGEHLLGGTAVSVIPQKTKMLTKAGSSYPLRQTVSRTYERPFPLRGSHLSNSFSVFLCLLDLRDSSTNGNCRVKPVLTLSKDNFQMIYAVRALISQKKGFIERFLRWTGGNA